MKKVILSFVLVISLCSLFGQDLFGEIPANFEKEFVGGRMPWHITSKTKNGIISIFVYEDTREVLLSENGKYLFITSGTDVVGGIEFYDIINRKYLFSNSYAGDKPNWKNNSVSYESVELVGDGFSVRRSMEFNNGKLHHGKQYIGEYHSFSDNKAPLSMDYSIENYGPLIEISEFFLERMKQMAEKYPDLKEKFDRILQNQMTKEEAILETADDVSGLIDILMNAYFDEDEAVDLFSNMFILLDKAHSEKILSSDQINSKLNGMLKILNIEDQTAKKLFK